MAGVQYFKRIVNRAVNLIIGERRLRHYWLKRTDEQILQQYWSDQESPNRLLAHDLIRNEIGDGGVFLDYGSHVGTLFRTMAETIASKNLRCFAVEPNEEAFDFMLANLPFVEGLKGDDEAFLVTNFPDTRVSVAAATGVFCTMSSARAHSVIKKLCDISDTVIIGDSVANIDGVASRMIPEPLHYQHPFRTWLADLDFSIIKMVPVPRSMPQLQSYMVARKLKTAAAKDIEGNTIATAAAIDAAD